MKKAAKASAAPQDERPKRRWSFSGNALLFTILLHVFFGVIAGFLIVEHFQKKHVDFQALGPPDQHTEVEHKVQMAKRNSLESAPQDVKRIVTTDVSAVTLPEVPDVPPPDDVTPSAMAGLGGEGLMGQGDGIGTGPGNGGTGDDINLNGYGSSGGEGFVGTLYDLKQSQGGHPTDIGENDVEQNKGFDSNWEKSPATQRGVAVLRDFVKSWNPDLLNSYYKSSQKLYATQICIPVAPSEDAPKAFHVASIVHPRRWIVIYRAKVIAPEAGQYRFIGFGDDFMAVRVGDENVLDASWTGTGEELDPGANGSDNVGPGLESQGLKCGKWIKMDPATPVDMQVLIGEGPGGSSGFVLLVQKQGDTSTPGDYPVFQLKDGPIPNLGLPGFTAKKMLFGTAPDDNPPSDASADAGG